MISVKIVVSETDDNHRFIFEDEELDSQISVSNYVHKSFDYWKDTVVDEIAEICNDYFSIDFYGNQEQYSYIKSCAEKNGFCSSCFNQANSVDKQSFAYYVDRLNNLQANRYASRTQKIQLGVIFPEESALRESCIRELNGAGFSGSNPEMKLPYFSISLEEIFEDEIEDYNNGYVSFTEIAAPKKSPIIASADKSQVIKNLYGYLMPLFEDFIREANIENSDAETSYSGAITVVPDKMYIGDTIACDFNSFYGSQDLDIVFAPNHIISNRNNRLFAEKVGSTTITVRKHGSLDDILMKKTIEVVEHSYVHSFDIVNPIEKIELGETYRFVLDIKPDNAENKNEIVWSTATPGIVSVDRYGNVRTLHEGNAVVKASLGKEIEKTAIFLVNKELTEIRLSRTRIKAAAGSMVPVEVTLNSGIYNLADIKIDIENKHIASYSNGSVALLNRGKTTVSFVGPGGKTRANLQVEVV